MRTTLTKKDLHGDNTGLHPALLFAAFCAVSMIVLALIPFSS